MIQGSYCLIKETIIQCLHNDSFILSLRLVSLCDNTEIQTRLKTGSIAENLYPSWDGTQTN